MTGEDEPTDDERTNSTSRRRVLAGSAGLALVGLPTVDAALARQDDDGMTTTTTETEMGTETEMDGEGDQRFTVRIENVSEEGTLMPSDDSQQPVPLSPGAYAVHVDPGALFTAEEQDRGEGLEAIAEDGDPSTLAEALSMTEAVSDGGAFTTPVGADEPAPIGPGGAYEFTVTASPGDRLSFATMFVPSNDLFFAPDDRGIGLFDGETPLEGDVTGSVGLWDAGTEVNEEPGVGSNQVQRQSGPDTGEDEGGAVRLVSEVADGYDYPCACEVIRVTLTPEMG